MDAVVLSGSDKKTEEKLGVTNKALLPIGGKPMIEYVVDALLAAPAIDKVIIAGNATLKEYFAAWERVTVTVSGESAVDSFLSVLPYTDIDADQLLLCSNDLPLLTGQIIENFVALCQPRGLDVYYPVVSEATNKMHYPETVRTYIKFKEGQYTGGNVFLVRPKAILGCREKAEKLIAARKSPMKIAGIVGPTCLAKFATGKLDFPSCIKIGHKALGLTGKVVVCPYPEISIDVDKTSDLELVEKTLQKRQVAV